MLAMCEYASPWQSLFRLDRYRCQHSLFFFTQWSTCCQLVVISTTPCPTRLFVTWRLPGWPNELHGRNTRQSFIAIQMCYVLPVFQMLPRLKSTLARSILRGVLPPGGVHLTNVCAVLAYTFHILVRCYTITGISSICERGPICIWYCYIKCCNFHKLKSMLCRTLCMYLFVLLYMPLR